MQDRAVQIKEGARDAIIASGNQRFQDRELMADEVMKLKYANERLIARCSTLQQNMIRTSQMLNHERSVAQAERMHFAEEDMNVGDLRNELHVTKTVLDVEGKKSNVTFMQLRTQLDEERKNSERQIAMISEIPPLPVSSSLSSSDVAPKVEVQRIRQELALANAKKTSIRDDRDELLVNNMRLQNLIKKH